MMKILKKIRALILIVSLCLNCEYIFATAFVVTSNADAGAGTLRNVINALNADLTSTAAAPHTVTFNAAMTITLDNSFMNPLPNITRHCNIDGGVLGNTVLNLANSGNVPYGLRFEGANVHNSTVQNMVIHNSGSGAHIWFNPSAGSESRITVHNNRIGTNAAGTGPGPRNPDIGHGVYLGDNVIVGGTSGCVITNNLISGIGGGAYAIQIDRSLGNHTISNNLIGTDATGTVGGASFTIHGGILIRWPNSGNTISDNTISNISTRGIECWNGTTNSTFSGNKIGTNSAGTVGGVDFRLVTDGLHLNNGCSNNTVENNIVSNCNSGIFLWDNCNNNIIRSNFVGTDVTGNAGGVNFRTHWDGIQLDNNCSNNLIGGLAAADGNVICNSWQAGIAIKGGSTRFNRVLNNKVGVGLDGVTAIGNDRYGIYIGWGPQNNSIGAITAGGTVYGNIIANTLGNDILGAGAPGTGSGIFLDRDNTINNSIRGNSIYCNLNTLDGITWDATSIPQSNVATPTINAASTDINVYGSGLAVGDTVDLYYNETVCMSCPRVSGITYIGTTIANASGDWSYTGGVAVSSRITITVTKNVGASYGNTSRFSPCSNFIILPIELISFTAQKSPQGVLINWATAKETNNNYFMLQRSIDGIHFETIAIIEGHGNSSTIRNYSFVDNSALNGFVYYQLVQVDYDGTSSSSHIVHVNIAAGESFIVYPSPATMGTNINVSISGQTDNPHTFIIINALGQTILSRTGYETNHSISTENFARGIYSVLLYRENQKLEISKFIIQ
jgi:parallel beta-helix repeat protein